MLDCYKALDTCRNMHGAIPWTDAKAYCDYHEMNDEEFEEVWYLIQRIDDALREKAEKEKPNG